MADKKNVKKVVASKKKSVRNNVDKRVLSERLFEEKMCERNAKRNKLGYWLIGVGGAVAFMLILSAAVTQCTGNKRAVADKDAQNKELKEELRQAQERIEKLYGRVCRLDSKLEDCEQDKRDCQPCKKPTPKPVAKPAPRPVAKPKPMPTPKPAPAPQPKPVAKPIMVYDTVVVRDTVRVDGPVVHDTVLLGDNGPVVPDTVFVRDTVRVPDARPATVPADTSARVIKHSDTAAVSFSASFRNKMASNAKCR